MHNCNLNFYWSRRTYYAFFEETLLRLLQSLIINTIPFVRIAFFHIRSCGECRTLVVISALLLAMAGFYSILTDSVLSIYTNSMNR